MPDLFGPPWHLWVLLHAFGQGLLFDPRPPADLKVVVLKRAVCCLEGRLLSRGPLFVAGEGDPHTEGDDHSSKAIPSNLILCGSGLAEYIGVRHLWLHKHSQALISLHKEGRFTKYASLGRCISWMECVDV